MTLAPSQWTPVKRADQTTGWLAGFFGGSFKFIQFQSYLGFGPIFLVWNLETFSHQVLLKFRPVGGGIVCLPVFLSFCLFVQLRERRLCPQTGSGFCWRCGESGLATQILSDSLSHYYLSDLWVWSASRSLSLCPEKGQIIPQCWRWQWRLTAHTNDDLGWTFMWWLAENDPFHIFIFLKKTYIGTLCGLSLCLCRIISGKINHWAHILTLDLPLSRQGYGNQVKTRDDTTKRESFAHCTHEHLTTTTRKLFVFLLTIFDGFIPSAQEWWHWSRFCKIVWANLTRVGAILRWGANIVSPAAMKMSHRKLKQMKMLHSLEEERSDGAGMWW